MNKLYFLNKTKFFVAAIGTYFLLVAAGLLFFVVSFGQLLAVDERQDQYEQDIEAIKERIHGVHISLDGLSSDKTTLQGTLADLDGQINQLQGWIAQTQAEIGRLDQEIATAEQDIKAQKDILNHLIFLLYERSGASALELMITADTFTDYLNDQEHLSRLKEDMTQSIHQVQALQVKLEADRQTQVTLLGNQKAQEISLNAVRWEKNNLLQVTLNEEQRFQTHLAELKAEQERLEKALEEYLASLIRSQVTFGRVTAGQMIGRNGNTGWSTGPHLHLVIYTADEVRHDPLTYLRNNNLVWPMGGSGGWVSQGFHPAHRALDIAAHEGTPILAIAAGNIIHRGCLYSGNYSTFGVILDHGGFFSIYIHMQAPNNAKYSQCSINRRSTYGTPSIDYSVTE